MRLYGWSMRTMYKPAGNVRETGGGGVFLSRPSCLSRPPLPLCPILPLIRPAGGGRVGRRRILSRGPAFAGHGDGELRGRARDLDALFLQHFQELGLRTRPGIVGGEHVRRGPLGLGFENRSLALQVVIAQEQLAVAGEVVERGEQSRLLVVVVVALRPGRL